jgi:ubiquinone/menaquinone biosynthesis C-methylase UbiE
VDAVATRVIPLINAGALAQRYDQLASSWNHRLDRLGYPAAYEALFHTLRQRGCLQPPGPGACVLDAGIGAGALSRALLKVLNWEASSPVNPDLRLHGLDISTGMLAQARRTLAGLQPPLRTHWGDSRCLLPTRVGHFDLVMSAHMLEHCLHPQEEIKRLATLLKPGATLLVVATRPGFAARLLAMKWDLRTFCATELNTWLAAAGCTPAQVVALGRPWSVSRRLSVAYVAVAK